MFTNAAVLVFITKFLLNRLSAEEFGMLRYAITMQGVLMFLDLGLGVALNRFVSRHIAIHDTHGLNAAISFASALFLGLGAAAGLAMVGLGLILPSLITGASDDLYHKGLILMACIGGALALRFWSYAPKGVLFGIQQHFVANIVLTVSAMVRAAAITLFFLVMPSSGLPAVGFCFVGASALCTVLMWTSAKWRLPEMRASIKLVNKNVAKEMLGFSLWVTLLGITTVLISGAPTFFAGKLYGAESVAFFSLSLLVVTQLEQISGGFALALIPVAGKHKAMQNTGVLQELMVRGTKFCAVICFPLGIVLVIFAYPLFEWFKEGFGWTWILLAIMILPSLMRATQRMSSAVLMGAGTVKGLALGQSIVVLLIAVLSLLFAVYFDMKLYGIALGAAIPILAYDSVYKPAYASRQIGLGWWRYMAASYGRVLLATAPAAAVAFALLYYAYPKGLLDLIFEMALCVMILAVFYFLFVLKKTDRLTVLNLFRSARASDNLTLGGAGIKTEPPLSE